MTAKTVTIDGRIVGSGHPPYVVAEMSGNHNGDIERAFKILIAAAEAGADCVKLQTYTADTITIDAPQDDFRITEGPWAGRTLYELYEWAHTPWEWHQALFDRARDLGITIFSSPFDETAVDFLMDLGTPAFKVASFEAVDLPLVEYMAKTGKPMVVSTGMANLEEIERTVNSIRATGNDQIILLHCVSGYPTPVDEINLATMPDLARRFGTIPGLSDHTLGIEASVAAVALGANFIEKHVTLERADGGPDAAFSLEPEELSALCSACKNAFAALGSAHYERKASEEKNARFRRSVYVVKDMKAGEVFTPETIRRIRPGFGLAPEFYPKIIGLKATQDIARGTPLDWTLVENS